MVRPVSSSREFTRRQREYKRARSPCRANTRHRWSSTGRSSSWARMQLVPGRDRAVRPGGEAAPGDRLQAQEPDVGRADDRPFPPGRATGVDLFAAIVEDTCRLRSTVARIAASISFNAACGAQARPRSPDSHPVSISDPDRSRVETRRSALRSAVLLPRPAEGRAGRCPVVGGRRPCHPSCSPSPTARSCRKESGPLFSSRTNSCVTTSQVDTRTGPRPRARGGVRTLMQATEGPPGQKRRYRDIFAPAGVAG